MADLVMLNDPDNPILSGLRVALLAQADDILLISLSAEGLQPRPNALDACCTPRQSLLASDTTPPLHVPTYSHFSSLHFIFPILFLSFLLHPTSTFSSSLHLSLPALCFLLAPILVRRSIVHPDRIPIRRLERKLGTVTASHPRADCHFVLVRRLLDRPYRIPFRLRGTWRLVSVTSTPLQYFHSYIVRPMSTLYPSRTQLSLFHLRCSRIFARLHATIAERYFRLPPITLNASIFLLPRWFYV
ncbi:hypothetical protein C8J57DRAFT_1519764 [Mycena rebaudengoi]|nr:hypothetical protein C8J57DRAFT_1519764 [Mycena rebaudengoi]